MKKVTVLSTIGAVIATSGCLFLANGVAGASSISNTGPYSYNRIMSHYMNSVLVQNQNLLYLNNQNHQTAYSGAAYVSGNTGNGGYGGAGGSGGNSQPNYCHTGNSSNGGYGSGSGGNYTPRMNNGYDNNQQYTNGGGYGNGGSGANNGGSAMTGDASNYSGTRATVAVENNMPSDMSQQYAMSSAGYGGGQIYNTGPRSYNAIDNEASNNFTQTNVNDIRLTSNNDQHAYSGNAMVSGNTRGGSAMTGDASNYNSTNFAVTIANN